MEGVVLVMWVKRKAYPCRQAYRWLFAAVRWPYLFLLGAWVGLGGWIGVDERVSG